jgi:hypothetical protein
MNGTAILAELLTTPEGKTLEFKRDLSSLRPILSTNRQVGPEILAELQRFISGLSSDQQDPS